MHAVKLAVTMIILALLCIVASGATERGNTEVRLDGSIQNVSVGSSDQTFLSAQLVLNHYLSDYFSVGLAIRPSGQITSVDGEADDTVFSQLFLLGRGDLYMAGSASSVVPYLGAHAGIISYRYESGGEDESASVFTIGGQIGFKIFASERTSFNIELDISVYTPEDDSLGRESEDITVTSLFFGYSYYF